mmetsp:Transcript_82323/g.181056  ORF Transcript_82323/g.181056 Transcript_82323/m.181056 type:complete len:525 (-) Transcript_82323:42-1616(-)
MATSGGVANDVITPGEEQTAAQTAERIKQDQNEVQLVQQWWPQLEEEDAKVLAKSRPILACFDDRILAEVIDTGSAFHTVLSPDRLDAVHRQYGTGHEPGLEPLRKALQLRGYKAQARALGMLLFKEVRTLHEDSLRSGHHAASSALNSIPTPSRSPAPAATSSSMPSGSSAEAHSLEIVPQAPQRYIRSEAYPEGANMAARRAPSRTSEIIESLPPDFEYWVTGKAGEWLEVKLEGSPSKAYVLHTISGQVMLLPQPTTAHAKPPAATTANATNAATHAASASSSSSFAPPPALGRLDEVYDPPQRWVQSETYPPGAQMAAKDAPGKEGKQVATLAHDHEYYATGRVGDYLQITHVIDGLSQTVYVFHTLGNLVLLKPANTSSIGSSAASNAAAASSGRVSAVVARFESSQRSMSAGTPERRQIASPTPQQQQQQHHHHQLQYTSYLEQQLQQLKLEGQQQWQIQQHRASQAAAAGAASEVRIEALESQVAMQERHIQVLQQEIQQLRSAFSSAAAALAAVGA